MSDAIKRYLDNSEMIIAHGQAGRSRCESVFSLNRMVGDYARVYDELIELG